MQVVGAGRAMRGHGKVLRSVLALLCAGLALSIVLLWASQPAFAGTWSPQVSGTTETLRSVAFADASNGWAVGTAGTILHTSDGGATWLAQAPDATCYFYSVAFPDASNGWAVGDQGTILHTSDGGATWLAQESGTATILRGVAFADASEGWIACLDGSILHTADGGATWATQCSGMTTHGLNGIDFVDSLNGWAVGYSGTVLHTSDGGATWAAQNIDTYHALLDVDFSDTAHGWVAVDDGSLYCTSDGGTNWVLQSTGETNFLDGVAFVSATTGWTAGNSGTIACTTDGGATWTSQSSGTARNLRDCAFVSAARGWVVGYGGTILSYACDAPTVTITGADAQWHSSPVTLTATATVDSDLTLSSLEYSTDGGATWTAVPGSGLTRTLTISADGETTVQVRATDSASQTATGAATVKVDDETPTIAVAGAGARWHRSPVTLTFTPSTGPSGLAAVEYKLGGGGWATLEKAGGAYALTISRQGKTKVRYRATSVAGLASATGATTVKIDRTAPQLRLASRSLRIWTRTGRTLRVKLRWTDAASTRAVLQARLTQYGSQKQQLCRMTLTRRGEWQVVTLRFRPQTPGRYALHLVLTDQGGRSCRGSALVVARR